MPNYEYKCMNCENVFEHFSLIKDRSKPEKKPCTICGEKKIKQVILTVPFMQMDSRNDIHSAKGGFKDAMQRVTEAPGIKGSKRAKELKERYNL